MNIKEPKTGFSGLTINDIKSILLRDLNNDEISLFNLLLPFFEAFLIKKTGRQFYVSDTEYFEEFFYPDNEGVFLFSSYPVNKINKIYFDNELVYQDGANNNKINKDIDFKVSDLSIEFFISLNCNELKVEYNLKKFWGDDVKVAIVQAIAEAVGDSDYQIRDVKNLSVGGFNLNQNNKYHLLKEVITYYKKRNL